MYLDSVWWFRVTLEGAVFFIGVPGNLLIIHVYASKRPKVTPHIFIIGLAVADFTVCLLRAITLVQLFPPMDKLSASSQFFCRVPPSVDAWPKYTSILLTLAVAIDRYLAICRPRGRRLTVRRAKHAVCVCIAVSSFFTLSYLLMYGVVPLEGGTTACQFVVPPAVIIVQFSLLEISFVVSLVIIIVLYIKVYRAVSRMAKVRPGNIVRRDAFQNPSGSLTSHDNSTARAEGLTPNQLIATASRQTNPRIPSAEDLETRQAVPHRSHPAAGASSNALPKPAWSADQHSGELPILNAPLPSSNNAATPTDPAPVGNAPNAPQFHRKTTLMLVASTVVFVVTLLPICVILAVYPLILPLLQNQAFRFLVNVASYVNLINNAANPVLFSLINRRFREDVRRSLGKLGRGIGCSFREQPQ